MQISWLYFALVLDYNILFFGSLVNIVDHYKINKHKEAFVWNAMLDMQGNNTKNASYETDGEKQRMIQMYLEAQNFERLSMKELIQLETQFAARLRKTRSKKTQLMINQVEALQKEEEQLREENHCIEEEMTTEMAEMEKEMDMNACPSAYYAFFT